jgi:hypothetical protein
MIKFKCISLFLLLGLLSCQEDTEVKCEADYDVEVFVKLVIDGQYDSWQLPMFCPQDIPALLEYANDFQEIISFPHNLLSSYMPPRITLGESLLWTIEAIKWNYNTDHWLYPSYHPVLCKDGFEYDPSKGLLNESEFFEVYELYLNWWNENQGNEFYSFYKADILNESGYHWL